MLHHVDIHVTNLESAQALFDALAPHIGYRRLSVDPDFVGYETAAGGRPRFGLILDPEHRAGSMRIAFAVATPQEVDAAARAAEQGGAQNVEGPSLHPEYEDDYYAVFLEDADGNRFEVLADAQAKTQPS